MPQLVEQFLEKLFEKMSQEQRDHFFSLPEEKQMEYKVKILEKAKKELLSIHEDEEGIKIRLNKGQFFLMAVEKWLENNSK